MARGRGVEERSGPRRCAIYTRKSTEEGLDQEFNSLDAQREACAAYVLSQRHEGWTLLPDTYDDGGYSGGTMDRPGLRQLLAEVEAGRVDVIVVYKVDRLTRALSDFAKIVEILDGAGASFVSITQSFNTTTSMGRLTLNVLLSFAQFEREVISERVRDKIAASKRKGMWMGGPVPLGYDVVTRKLVPNEAEAETVRTIFRRYLDVGTVAALVRALDREGIRSKLQNWSNGRIRGGTPFGRGALYHLLANRLYRGEIRHHDEWHPGEHVAIIEEQLWGSVQAQLASNAVARRMHSNARDGSLLAGRIRDGQGRAMRPSHASKGSVRYRYYVSFENDGQASTNRAERIAAGDIEPPMLISMCNMLRDRSALIGLLAVELDAEDTSAMLGQAEKLAKIFETGSSLDQRALLNELNIRLVVDGNSLDANIDLDGLRTRLGVTSPSEHGHRHQLDLPSRLRHRAHEIRLVVPGDDAKPAHRDGRLVALLVKAKAAQQQLLSHGSESALSFYSDKHVARLARLGWLAPDIISAILDGTAPRTLTARQLLRAGELPLAWPEQRRLFGFA
jgi:site-specific DNA recombinase